MTIEKLFTEFKKLVEEDKIYVYERYNNANLFLDFRKAYGITLKPKDENFLIELLQDEQWQWFVPNALRVLEGFPKNLFHELIKKAVHTSDPSFNNNFIDPCLRVYDAFPIDKLLITYLKNGTKKEKIGALNAFYWTRPHIRTYYSGKDFKDKETFGYKSRWNEEFNVYDWSRDLEKMNQMEFEEYSKKVNVMILNRTAILLEEFFSQEDLDIRYHITLCLPKHIKNFPKTLHKEAKRYFNLKKK